MSIPGMKSIGCRSMFCLSALSLVVGMLCGCGKAGPDATTPVVVEQPSSDLASLRKAVDDALQAGTIEATDSAATIVGENLSGLKESNPDKQQTITQLDGLLGQLTSTGEVSQRMRLLQSIKARLAELK